MRMLRYRTVITWLLLCIVKLVKNDQKAAFADGELVHDPEHRETFVYNHKVDGKRAAKLRPATEKERERFAEFANPTRP